MTKPIIDILARGLNKSTSQYKSIKEINEVLTSVVEKADEALEAAEKVESFEGRMEVVENSMIISDEEDFHRNEQKKIKLADKSYNPVNFSGLGRIYMRKNIKYVDYDTILRFDGFVDNITTEQLIYRVPTLFYFDITKKKFYGAEFVNGTRVYYGLGLLPGGIDPNPGYTTPSSNIGYVYDDALYSYSSSDGLTEVEGQQKNVLTQEMINDENTIYHIQYDYDLQGETINIPEGCVLLFEGGSICNGSIVGANTSIISATTKMPFVDIEQSGTFVTYATKEEVDAKADANSVYSKSDVDTLLAGKADTTAIPTKLGDLQNDEGYAKTTQVENMLQEGFYDKTEVDHKVDDLQLGKADASDVEALSTTITGDYYDKTVVDTLLGNKADITSIPTNLSQLNNDSGYATTTQIEETLQDGYYGKQDVDDKVSNLQQAKADATTVANLDNRLTTDYYGKTDVDGLLRNAGDTAHRPDDLTQSDAGFSYFDTELGKVIIVQPYNRGTALPFDGFIKDITDFEVLLYSNAVEGVYYDTDDDKFVFKFFHPQNYEYAYSSRVRGNDYSNYTNPNIGSLFEYGGKVYKHNGSYLEIAEANSVKFVDANGFSAAQTRGTTAEREALLVDGPISSLDVGFGFYDTDLKVQCKLAVINGEKVWLTDDGHTPALTKGKTVLRPANLKAEFDIGYKYYDTDLGKSVHVESIDNGVITWTDDDTVLTNVSELNNDAGYLTEHQSLDNYYTKSQSDERYIREHQSLDNYYTKAECDNKYLTEHQSLSNYLTAEQTSMAVQAGMNEVIAMIPDSYTKEEVDELLRPNAYERPTLGADDKGYRWFDVTSNKSVYWNGTKWVDEKGYSEAPNTTTLDDISATHAHLTVADKGYSCFLTDVNKVVYLAKVTALHGDVTLLHKWVYADGTTALDEGSVAVTPNISDEPHA